MIRSNSYYHQQIIIKQNILSVQQSLNMWNNRFSIFFCPGMINMILLLVASLLFMWAVLTTMLDWSATFDRQCPTIGIKKFLEMCLRPSIVHVLTNYLSNRSVSVKFNESTSRVHHMPGGGSQGTLLGVLEYLVQC